MKILLLTLIIIVSIILVKICRVKMNTTKAYVNGFCDAIENKPFDFRYEKELLARIKQREAALEKNKKSAAFSAWALGQVKSIQLEYNEAQKWFQEAVRLDPDEKLYRESLEKVRKEQP